MFPIKLEKARYIPSDGKIGFAKKVRANILGQITHSGFTLQAYSVEQYAFTAPWFRYIWRRWSFLNLLTNGSIEINELKDDDVIVNYKLRFTEFLVYALAFTLIPGFFYFVTEVLIFGLLLIWPVFYVGSVILAASGFSKLVQKAYENTLKEYE